MADIASPSAVSPLRTSQVATRPQNEAVDAGLRARAEEFESIFLNVMLSSAFKGIGDDDPFNGQATETWRGLQVEQFAKSISDSGGIGIADQIYNELLLMQENANR